MLSLRHQVFNLQLFRRWGVMAQGKKGRTVLKDFNSWIADLNLSSALVVENRVDQICEGVKDRLNPKDELEYIKVMQSHLFLEVWSQIRTFVAEQWGKGDYLANVKLFNVQKRTRKDIQSHHPNNRRRQKQRPRVSLKSSSPKLLYSASLQIRSKKNHIQIPFQSHLLLLWKDRDTPLDFSDNAFPSATTLKAESKANGPSPTASSTNSCSVAVQPAKPRCNGQSNVQSNGNCTAPKRAPPKLPRPPKVKRCSFPPHIIVQVTTALVRRHRFETSWDIELQLNSKSFAMISGHQRQRHRELMVLPIKNMVYLQRDYEAIRNVNRMPLSAFVMGRDHLMEQKKQSQDELWHHVGGHGLTKKYFPKKLNESQMNALRESLKRPLTLIHGPPGTVELFCFLFPFCS